MSQTEAANPLIEQHLRQACTELDRSLRAGGDARAEQLLAKFPDLKEHLEAALEVIYTEFVTREELDQQPEPAEFLRRFPQWQAGLEQQFQVHVLLRDGGERSEHVQTVPTAEAASATSATVTIGTYDILEKIAQGNAGTVYKARQEGLNRIVALKVVKTGPQAAMPDQHRLRTEAEAVARLQHPNIVQIFEVGEETGKFYLSLEFVGGGSLAQKLAGNPRAASYAAGLVQILARAIHYAHQCGIIHRDLKPANVLLTTDGIPKITDFGLAKLLDRKGTSNTETGTVFGTPSYMAPEQAAGHTREIGPAADIYALGAILYEVLTGRPPFRAESLLTTLRQVVTDDAVAPDVLQPSVPRDLATICMKCLHKDPRRRYADASLLAEDLRRFQAGEPIQARRNGLIGRTWKWAKRRPSAAALLGVIGAAAIALFFGNFWYTTQLREAASKEQVAAALDRQRGDELADLADNIKRQHADSLLQAELLKKQVDSTRRSLYTIQLATVGATWRSDPVHALDLLEDKDNCPPEMRDFAWRLYYYLCKQDRVIVRGAAHDPRIIAYSPLGNLVAITSRRDGAIKLWDPVEDVEIATLQGHSGSVGAISFSPDGQVLISGGDDKTVRIWNVDDRVEKACLKGSSGAITAVAFSADGQMAASAARNGTVRVWNVGRSKEMFNLRGHNGPVWALKFAEDGQTLASGGEDHTVRTWDLIEQRERTRLQLRDNGPVVAVAFSPNGKRLAVTGSKTPDVELWDLETRYLKAIFRGHVDQVHTLTFSPDGQTVATGSEDRTVRLWEVDSGVAKYTFKGHYNAVRCLVFSPDGQTLISGADEPGVRLWAMNTREVGVRPDPDPQRRANHRIVAMTYSPDGQTLATGSHDGTLKLIDPETRSEKASFKANAGILWSVAFSGDSRYLATGGEDHTVRLWDASTHKELYAVGKLRHRIYCVAFSPDSKLLAAAGEYSGVVVWDVETRQELGRIETPDRVAASLGFAPDGKTLAIGNFDGSVDLHNLPAGEKRLTRTGHHKSVLFVAYSPDGKTLATGSMDNTVKLWDAETMQERSTLRWNSGYVFSVAFTPDSKTIAVGGGSRVGSYLPGEVKLWDVPTGHGRATLAGHTGPVAFAPDGRSLATVMNFTTVRIWQTSAPTPPSAMGMNWKP